MKIPRCLDSADEVIAMIREEHAKWLARPPAAAGDG